MQIIDKPYFKCDFCDKKMFRKCDMTLHEKWCKNNPANKHKCFEYCLHLIKSEEEYEGNSRGEDYVGQRTVFTCAILKQKMFSFIAERKRLPVINESDTIRMPLECDKYKNQTENYLFGDSTDDTVAQSGEIMDYMKDWF